MSSVTDNTARPLPRRFMERQGPLRVVLIGAGGNGSEMFDGLIRIHQGLIALGTDGLTVNVFDADDVEPSNVVRQRFYPHEIGMNKATALVHRANMLMGTAWEDHPCHAGEALMRRIVQHADLVITAVDNVATRQSLIAASGDRTAVIPGANPLWLDMGCDRDKGQVVLGDLSHTDAGNELPNAVAHFPDLATTEDRDEAPSCGAAESLARQDLMINQQTAAAATNLVWKSLRSAQIPFNGVVIDLSCGLTQAIPFMPREADAA